MISANRLDQRDHKMVEKFCQTKPQYETQQEGAVVEFGALVRGFDPLGRRIVQFGHEG